ncbi:hypothetical protein CCACVL1_08139, partial [Corchorus capsularis]
IHEGSYLSIKHHLQGDTSGFGVNIGFFVGWHVSFDSSMHLFPKWTTSLLDMGSL